MRGHSSIIFALVAATVACLAIVAGFVVIGSPEHVRKQQLDQIRSANLVSLSAAISAYRNTHGALPTSLDNILHGTTLNVALKDPEGHAYAYQVTGIYSYKICADFSLPSGNKSPGMLPESVFALHPAGHYCYQLEARPSANR